MLDDENCIHLTDIKAKYGPENDNIWNQGEIQPLHTNRTWSYVDIEEKVKEVTISRWLSLIVFRSFCLFP